MLDKIPITFTYEGKEYKGVFSKVAGSGGTAKFHLTIDNYFQGQLMLTENYGWKFHSNNGKFEEMTDYFADYVVAYYQ